ncbi:TetR/AcrR family transcriptional regulator [Rubrivivax rivuli]|uniref:TetR/AcrR family transcriptional regulator n=1 Tax=Rubrivivax rivuli TaxID=1862385 RepID=UPI0013E3EF83|nr:helix-turn-helix domain-containing protein [Rubrivivax rivuli]
MQKDKPGATPTASGASSNDRRVRRTREALREALLSLLAEVGWDQIDVATLCERADVGRSTFYLHYTDKTALLRGAFDDLQALLHLTASDADPTAPYPFLPGLLAHVHEQRIVFRSLLGRRSGQVVRDHFSALLIDLFAQAHDGSARHHRARPGADDARSHMLAGCLFQLMVWWMGMARPAPPQDIASMFQTFAVARASA